jgi:hypothetical protein
MHNAVSSLGQLAESRNKPQTEQELASFCRWLTSVDASSGGTRPPDTRIMILQARFENSLPPSDLEQRGQVRCTHCCTCVELGSELAKLVTAWPSLTRPQRETLATIAMSLRRPGGLGE